MTREEMIKEAAQTVASFAALPDFNQSLAQLRRNAAAYGIDLSGCSDKFAVSSRIFDYADDWARGTIEQLARMLGCSYEEAARAVGGL
jgi:hypothetical protein